MPLRGSKWEKQRGLRAEFSGLTSAGIKVILYLLKLAVFKAIKWLLKLKYLLKFILVYLP